MGHAKRTNQRRILQGGQVEKQSTSSRLCLVNIEFFFLLLIKSHLTKKLNFDMRNFQIVIQSTVQTSVTVN